MDNNKTVYVITGATGHPKLLDCMKSVAMQTYDNVIHVVVVDGKQYYGKVKEALELNRFDKSSVELIVIPWNTGGNGYLGYLIYSSIANLIKNGYICFLDEDNWFQPNHIESCVNAVNKHNLDWCYSLRRIYNSKDQFLFDDNCNSLGIWPCYDGYHNLIDTSCYFFTPAAADRCVNAIRRKASVHGELDGDRALTKKVLSLDMLFSCTGNHTVNYRLHDNVHFPEQEAIDWFVKGNKLYEKMYRFFPWLNGESEGVLKEHNTLSLGYKESLFEE